MTRYALMTAGIACSATAQVLLKQAARAVPYGSQWLLWMGASGATYAAAFALYAVVLRQFPLSVAAPAMTIAVMCAVVAAGALLGEPLSARRVVGVLLGVASVVAVLG